MASAIINIIKQKAQAPSFYNVEYVFKRAN